jgi:hypothetical protein
VHVVFDLKVLFLSGFHPIGLPKSELVGSSFSLSGFNSRPKCHRQGKTTGLSRFEGVLSKYTQPFSRRFSLTTGSLDSTHPIQDNDFTERNEKLKLGKIGSKLFIDQLRRDSQMLTSLNIMDYSLLLGVHYRDKPIPAEMQEDVEASADDGKKDDDEFGVARNRRQSNYGIKEQRVTVTPSKSLYATLCVVFDLGVCALAHCVSFRFFFRHVSPPSSRQSVFEVRKVDIEEEPQLASLSSSAPRGRTRSIAGSLADVAVANAAAAASAAASVGSSAGSTATTSAPAGSVASASTDAGVAGASASSVPALVDDVDDTR